jgi:hypothetical protein
MKKSTLIILLLAILAGAAAYYFDWKRGEKEAGKAPADASKLAFTVQPDEIQSLTISYPADPKSQPVSFEKRDGAWQITQPLQTGADVPAIQGIVQGLAAARIEQTVPGTPDRLKVYGLDPPDVILDFQLKNGAKHSAQLGKKDFTGSSVYAVLDHGKDVALVPESLLVSSDKPLQVLRDHSVLHIDSSEVRSFDLKNAAGEVVAAKDKTGWNLIKPSPGGADSDAVNVLVAAISAAKFVNIESETADSLAMYGAKYGLANPAITFTTGDDKGKSATLLIGKKEGDEYFARDASRPTIFRVNQDLVKKLAVGYPDLRDKKIVRLDPADIVHVEIHNANGTIACSRKGDADWVFDEPADQKGKSASLEKLFSALGEARADQIIDHPAPDIFARLAKPAFDAALTAKDGKKMNIAISKESGDFVYARNSAAPTVYKLKKQILETLNFKPPDLAF